eukprot:767701-Hanusia_phi.AAC.11
MRICFLPQQHHHLPAQYYTLATAALAHVVGIDHKGARADALLARFASLAAADLLPRHLLAHPRLVLTTTRRARRARFSSATLR